MSIDAMRWSFQQKIKPSTTKFVLVALGDYADADGCVWPSLKDLSAKTGQDRKTVIASLDRLEAEGYLVDTGRRKGLSGQVKVYQFNFNRTEPSENADMGTKSYPQSTENGTIKECQKRNSTKNGTVPFFPSKSTVFPAKEYRFSHERVPKTVHGTTNEPSMKPQGTLNTAHARGEVALLCRKNGVDASASDPRLVAVAEQIDIETIEAAIEQARKSKPLPARIGFGYVIKILERWSKEAAEINVVGAKPRESKDDERERVLDKLTGKSRRYDDARTIDGQVNVV